jgi:carbohydrate kinase (thermoresistant glucokinase family)
VIVFVMGVSGSGKSAVGSGAAARLGWEFLEGDAFHAPANIAKMSGGVPLTDEDRAPWLDALAGAIASARDRGRSVVLACSGLRRAHRDAITRGRRDDVLLVWLTGDQQLIRERMARRAHFMPVELVGSQLATLEAPDADEDALVIDVSEPLDVIVERVVAAVRVRH